VQTEYFKMNPKPTAGTYMGITKPKFTHSLVGKGTSMPDPHSQMCEKNNFKINPKPTIDTGRVITKPKFTHSLVSKGKSMLDLHAQLCKLNILK
jgi:hypothetical protein